MGNSVIPALVACIGFSAFDYAGYNLTKDDATALVCYRISQVAVQALITWALWENYGAQSAVKFNLIWWTFGCDWLYYGWANLLNPHHGWESRGAPGVNQISWGWWTPWGLLSGGKGSLLSSRSLAFQSVIGLSISIAI